MNQKEIFQNIYNGLNEQQKLAVDSLEGPVMVIAGPGTGKTQILSARIGKILLETDSRPENILCLTYTESGALAMRKRLQFFIGPDAYKVGIYTFHAFCNEVIQQNLSLFQKSDLDPISELERIELFKELIDSFPKGHPLKRYRGDVYYETKPLKKLFSDMKKEGWTVEFINQKIGEYITSLPGRPEFIAKKSVGDFKKGDLRTDWIDQEVASMEKLRAAVNEFDRFQALMEARNRYDFDDMINWLIRAFEENESLLRRYQEQYLYILVDEFQDTSGTQNRLVQLLINFWEKPNVFVVGDDDQSIFRFQGANVENMHALANTYRKDLLTVVLTDNYRSVPSVLELSRNLINRNEQRLVKKMKGLSKDLVSANEKINRLTHTPEVKEYETQRQEMIDLVVQVERLLSDGIDPARIGIIYGQNKWGEELAQYFQIRNIPVYSKRNVNALDLPLIQKIITMLDWLNSELEIPDSGDELLFELLHFDWFQIPPMEIARLAVEVAERQFSATNKTSIRKLLHEKSNEPARELFSRSIHPGLQNASRILEQLLSDLPNTTLQSLLERIIRKTGLLNQVMKSEEKIWMIQILGAFFDFVKEETRRNPLMRVKDLLNILELMQKENIPLPLIQVNGREKAVNLMTVHGSKGLEFEWVFFAGCNANYWEKKKKVNQNYKLPDTLIPTLAYADDQDEDEELRRLFFVAITRAEQHLIFSYSRFRNDGKEMEPSMFIAEILKDQEIPVEKVFVSPELVAEFQLLGMQGIQAPEIEKGEEEFVERLLEKFVMNVSALNNYLKCPLEFYFKNLLRIPSPKNEYTEFGSAVHHALNELFKGMQENNSVFPGVEEFLGWFDWHMKRHRESFTKEQFARRMEYGHKILPAYYEKNVRRWNKIVSTERSIRNVVLEGVPLKGKIDKLEFDGNKVNIVDYKTGDPEKANAKLKGPNEKDPVGGDYWRQAVFYKILVDQYDRKGWQALSAEFDFVEPDRNNQYLKKSLNISSQDIFAVTLQITNAWKKIQLHDFYTGCGKPDCHWCHFVKTNQLAIDLHELDEENQDQPDLRDY
ncbi:MAG: ATP-dependent helicase [Chitinophagales bacterium]